MARKPYLALLLACCAGPAAADSFDDFAFPEFDSSARERSLIIESSPADASPSDVAPAPRDLPPVAGRAAAPRGRGVSLQAEAQPAQAQPADEAIAGSDVSPAAMPAPYAEAPYAIGPQSGYFAAPGPSSVSPLLAYMQCSPNTCGDVWAGFAEQHRRDMARYCTLPAHLRHGCPSHSLYAEPCIVGTKCGHLPINRYAPAAPACPSCDAPVGFAR